MTLMSDNGDIREDLRVPDSEVGKDITGKFEAGDDFMVSVSSLMLVIPCWTQEVTAGHCDQPLSLWCLQVSVISAMGEECAIGVKALANK